MATPRRGLQDIRTATGKVGKAILPHEVYLRISQIEIEKARKILEVEKAKQLITTFEERIAEIEAEKKALLQSVGEKGVTAARVVSRPPQSTNIFKMKY